MTAAVAVINTATHEARKAKLQPYFTARFPCIVCLTALDFLSTCELRHSTVYPCSKVADTGSSLGLDERRRP